MLVDVVLEIFDQVGVWVVGYYDWFRAVEGADEAWEAGAGAEFEDGFVGDERCGVGFEISC